MNNIKLKAWDNDKKQMAKVKAIDWAEDGTVSTCHLEYANGEIEKKYPDKEYCDDILFLKYTGLKDKNNKDIYEDDILETIAFGFNVEKFTTHILWDKIGFKLANRRNIFYCGQSNFTKMDDTRIVGNIHKNPELIN